MKNILQTYTDKELENIKKMVEEEIIERAVLKCFKYPGDSLPYPKVTKDELDRELQEISDERNLCFKSHFC